MGLRRVTSMRVSSAASTTGDGGNLAASDIPYALGFPTFERFRLEMMQNSRP